MTDPNKTDEENAHKARFAQLLMMLATSAMQQMGKIANPMTQETEVDLEGAEATIDLLDTLAHKTKGNLDEEEERYISDALSSLKMNFVAARKAGGAAPSPEAPQAEQDEAPSIETPREPDAQPAAEKEEERKPRFQKKYD